MTILIRDKISIDDFREAYRKTRLSPIQSNFLTEDGACPIYVIAHSLALENNDLIDSNVTYIATKYNIPNDEVWNFIDGVDRYSLFETEEKNPNFNYGKEVAKALFTENL